MTIRYEAKPGAKKKTAPKRKAASKGKKATAGKKAKQSPSTGTSGTDSHAKPKSDAHQTVRKGGNPPVLTGKDIPRVIEHLRASGGIKTVAAERLKISRRTLYRFIDAHPEIEEALRDIDAEIADVAEAQVVKAINGGDMQTVRWFLELKAKDRGYVRRVENTGPNGGAIPIAQKVDLSQCSDEELAILAKAAAKRESEANGK